MAVSLALAISAIKSGRREEGRQLLNLLIQQNPNDEKAWLWMSSVVDNDEQRARCLYHVLAIDPTSDVARKGLQVLGIVVSDSRPVKIPRDSQPIKIPKPTPQEDRRPFLIDPKTITDELPFTPVNTPFTNSQEGDGVQSEPAQIPSRPVPMEEMSAAQAKSGLLSRLSESAPPAPLTDTQEMVSPATQQAEHPSKPALVVTAEDTQQLPPGADSKPIQAVSTPTPHPSEPVPVVQPNPNVGMMPQGQITPLPGQLPAPGIDPFNSSQRTFNPPQPLPPQQPFVNDTRPSQPMPVIYPNQRAGAAQSDSSPIYPVGQQVPPNHAAPTMGMPVYQQQVQYPTFQGGAGFHSNTTMGMPFQSQHPSEPVPVVHSAGTLGMAPYGQAQPQNMGLHSNSTMMMPIMSEAEARARLMTNPAIPAANATAMALQNNQSYGDYPAANGNYAAYNEYQDDDEDDEVNILAVIIFGTLSVTALGGLGMLILLVFTTPAV